MADIEKNVSASKSTTYPVGSVTKQFTAALVLMQVDRGRLTLTDPIGKHLAGLTAEVSTITIEQLLNHTSGLKRAVIEPDSRFENMSVESLLSPASYRLENGELYVTPNGGSKQPLVFRSGNTCALGRSDSTTTVTFMLWTVVLAVVLIVTAWRDSAMPVFSDGLLALMGISAGTYPEFKGTERQPPGTWATS